MCYQVTVCNKKKLLLLLPSSSSATPVATTTTNSNAAHCVLLMHMLLLFLSQNQLWCGKLEHDRWMRFGCNRIKQSCCSFLSVPIWHFQPDLAYIKFHIQIYIGEGAQRNIVHDCVAGLLCFRLHVSNLLLNHFREPNVMFKVLQSVDKNEAEPQQNSLITDYFTDTEIQ